jgi:hypothetical protein
MEANDMAEKKWIQGAVNPEHEGDFSAAAKSAGMTTAAYARWVLRKGSGASTLKKRQANFALRMIEMHRK